MKIFDAHCDVLWRLWEDKYISFNENSPLQITYDGLMKYPGSIQCMAIFVPEEVPFSRKYEVALEMIDIFYEKIVKPFDKIKVIRNQEDAQALQSDEVGVILTLEGCDAIGTDLYRLRTLQRLGVRSVGLTWNYANAVADGVLEERGGGLTTFGKELVEELNSLELWADVSHLSVKGFWEVMERAKYPVATHSNCYQLCPHPRNLSDNQIKELIKRDGMIGINFFPLFLTTEDEATIADILRHIEHICALGGEFNIGLGSDFDGIDHTPVGLESYDKYEELINELSKIYTPEQVENFCFHNFIKKMI